MSTIDESGSPVEAPKLGPRDGSVIDLLKEDLKEIAGNRDVLIKIKGYEKSGLQVKYRLPESGEELNALGRKIMREFKDQWKRNFYTAVDTMILLCEGLYVQPEGAEEAVPFDPETPGVPCRFDEVLAEYINMNGAEGTARNVVRQLFGNNDVAIMSHAERLSRWIGDTSADVEAELWSLGE